MAKLTVVQAIASESEVRKSLNTTFYGAPNVELNKKYMFVTKDNHFRGLLEVCIHF